MGSRIESLGSIPSSPLRTLPFGGRPGFIGASITNGSSSSNAGTKAYPALVKASLIGVRKAVSSAPRGYPGQTSTYIASQVALSIADGLSILVIGPDFGTNSAGHSLTLAQYQADLIAVVTAAQLANIPVVCCKTMPKSLAVGGTAYRDLIGQYNTWLTFFCLLNSIPLADTYTATADPATGYLSAAFDSGDGVHPNDAGHAALATAISAVVAAALKEFPEIVSYGSGGLLTAGYEVMQTLWSDSAVGTGTFSARTLAAPGGATPLSVGQWSTASMNAAGWRIMSKGLGSLGTAFNVGDKLLIVGTISMTSSAGSACSLQLLRAGSVNLSVLGSTSSETPTHVAGVYTVQAADSSLTLGLNVNCTAGETVTARVGKCAVLNLTALGYDGLF